MGGRSVERGRLASPAPIRRIQQDSYRAGVGGVAEGEVGEAVAVEVPGHRQARRKQARIVAAGGLDMAADFNGDGLPDLAVGNATDPGTVSVLINAPDWGGAYRPRPPRTPVPHRALPSRPQRDGVAAMTAASRPQAVSSLPLTSTDLHPNLVPQSSVPTEMGQPAQPQAAVAPRAVLTARHAQEAVFERWVDPVVDVLAWNLVR